MFACALKSSARGLALLAAALIFSGCGEEPKPAAAPEAAKVVVVEVQAASVPRETTFSGLLAAKETVEVRARVGGYLAEKLFEDGAQVQAGDVLYRLDDRDLKAALETAKANTAKAKAAADNAEANRGRMVTLAESGSISLAQRDQAVARADEAQAAYQAARAEEEKAAVNLSYATITAPTSGYVSRSNVEVGSNVSAGEATLLTTVYNIDPIRVEFSVSDKEYARFKKTIADQGGRPEALTFTLALGDDRVAYPQPGVLEMADPVIDSRTNTLGVRALFPNPNHNLRPGMYVNLTAGAGEAEALVVPETAVVEQATSKAVFVVNDQNELAVVPVTVGRRLGARVEILSGLEKGQKVVVEGLVTARPGLKVEAELRPAETGGNGD